MIAAEFDRPAPDQARPAAARSRSQRIADALERLRTDVDLWVASASDSGEAYLVPLSFHWDGSRLTVATPMESVTERNLFSSRREKTRSTICSVSISIAASTDPAFVINAGS